MQGRMWTPPPIYSWDVTTDDASEGGVTGDREEALAAVKAALQRAPRGAEGVVDRVALSPLGWTTYVPLNPIARARRDRESGDVVWAEL
ncbi:hypothetical protein [Actinomadura oligospora]|uniref:hypothetical protein n=1 Tax=Actinomadura oligospora TaxID=111804 RepID=UPI0012F7649C|nr:hypothetical protein [Actinomadura oligospora]